MKINNNLLSTLWIFLALNYLFCDIFSLFYSETLNQLIDGKIGEIEFTQEFLLTFALVMEIPLLMVILSKVLKPKLNKIINIVAGLLMLTVQIGSLVEGNNTLHYIFFSLVEIAALLIIIWFAIKLQAKSNA